ncbi:hypothetical protein [Paraburkholderia caffeinilytica]|uniref:hypothetical protein n=1 Tax=Paraburkholderia caffeinilytica TaxID=1761016 RepID=UPI003DA0065C
MRYALVLVPILVAACTPPPSQVADANGVALEDVIKRVKLEVGLYQDYEIKHRADLPKGNACNGYVNFHITKVQMTLQTMRMVDLAASASIGPPLPTGYKLGLSAGGHHISKNTQTLSLSVFPIERAGQMSAKELSDDFVAINKDAPLAEALIGARQAVLNQSGTLPCYHLRPDPKPVGNTISFIMDIETKGQVGIDFTYAILSVSGSRATDNDNNNKIEITFEPYLDPQPKPGAKPLPAPIPSQPYPGEGFRD